MKVKNIGLLLTGMVLGAALCGGAVAAGITAIPTWQSIYVDGQKVEMTAYNIAGNNFVKLRDIGQAVGFNVYWQDGVQVDTMAPYTGEALASDSATSGISISSYKGTDLLTGDRSALVINPSGSYAVTSSDSSIVAVELVSGNWVIEAKSAGKAIITVISNNGRRASLAVTVTLPAAETDFTANMETRQEMIRLINQIRQENGAAELPVDDRLMNAAQDCAAQHQRKHGEYEWLALQRHGWEAGGGINLTMFSIDEKSGIAKQAVENWVNSPGHYQTLLDERSTCIGVGVSVVGRVAYCHMIVGDPNSHSPL